VLILLIIKRPDQPAYKTNSYMPVIHTIIQNF